MPDSTDEFAWIASLRSLTRGDPGALDLRDDAAVIAVRPGFDLVVSKDAMVEGVHFPPDESPDVIARRLLRTALSDLAAKAAAPFGYFLMTAWPPGRDGAWRDRFRAGLQVDGDEYAVSLLGGDTVSTPGPLTLSVTVVGWVEQGRAILRSGARDGDALVVCGAIGDGWLGLRALRGEIDDPDGRLAESFRLPVPLLRLRDLLFVHARACADVSDGLVADAGHLAEASGLRVSIDLANLPVSAGGERWLRRQPEPAQARLALATGGDDYALVCAVDPEVSGAFIGEALASGASARVMGAFGRGSGISVTMDGRPIRVGRSGWRHSDARTPDQDDR